MLIADGNHSLPMETSGHCAVSLAVACHVAQSQTGKGQAWDTCALSKSEESLQLATAASDEGIQRLFLVEQLLTFHAQPRRALCSCGQPVALLQGWVTPHYQQGSCRIR